MIEEEVQANEDIEPVEPNNEADSKPVQASEEVTYTVLVSNYDELTPYYDLQIALSCMTLGLLLTLIIAIVWTRYL